MCTKLKVIIACVDNYLYLIYHVNQVNRTLYDHYSTNTHGVTIRTIMTSLLPYRQRYYENKTFIVLY